MKLSELKYTDGFPEGGAKAGMVVRTTDPCGSAVYYDVVGELRPSDGNTIEDYGCGCCAGAYHITGWCWLAEEIEDED